MSTRSHGATKLATIALLAALVAAPLAAQTPHEMEPTDKIELFLQHLGKIVQIEPELYQSLLLEYEVGLTLGELGMAHPEPLLGDFILRGLERVHPALATAREHFEAGAAGDTARRDEAAAAFRSLIGKRDPFLSARCRLFLAEIDLAAGRHDAALRTAERIIRDDRMHLIPDWRACEIAASCFRAREQPVLEFLQHAILLTDFHDLPPAVEANARARLAELEKEAGRPVRVVGGWMDAVEKWVRRYETGEDPTRAKQGQILVALDKMIELQEARERNACKNCGSGSCGGSCRGGPPRGNRSSSPAQTSQLVEADGSINLRGVSRGNASSLWGLLRDRQGASALQSSKVKLPERYRKLLEQYYRGLSTSEEE